MIPAICDADEVGKHTTIGLISVELFSAQVDWEVELAVVIGETCRDVKVDHALSMVRGYTVANDISARRWQGKKGGSQWSRASMIPKPSSPHSRALNSCPTCRFQVVRLIPASWTQARGNR